MRYPNFPGVGERIRERLLALGYVIPATGEPDVARFIKAHHYDPRNFYPWLKTRTPAGANLDRLVADLKCSKAWLLLGAEMAHPIAGGSGGCLAQVCGKIGDIMTTRIRDFVHLWWSLFPQPQFAPAA